MAFMEAYKKLDNLCKDLFSSDVGITEYISCSNAAAALYMRITGKMTILLLSITGT